MFIILLGGALFLYFDIPAYEDLKSVSGIIKKVEVVKRNYAPRGGIRGGSNIWLMDNTKLYHRSDRVAHKVPMRKRVEVKGRYDSIRNDNTLHIYELKTSSQEIISYEATIKNTKLSSVFISIVSIFPLIMIIYSGMYLRKNS